MSVDVAAGDTILATDQQALRDDMIDIIVAADEIFVSTTGTAGTMRTAITQALATAGTSTIIAGWSPLTVKQAVDAVAVTQAGQTAIEAQTNENTYIPPDLLKKSPGVAKVWFRITAAGALEVPDHGVLSISDDGAGDHTITHSIAFSSSVYAAIGEINEAGGNSDVHSRFDAAATGTLDFETYVDSTGALYDIGYGVVIFGDQ